MLAKLQEGRRKHFCHEEELTDVDDFENNRNSRNEFLSQQSPIVDFTSENKSLSEAAGLSFEHIPTHLRGLKDYEIELVLKKSRRI